MKGVKPSSSSGSHNSFIKPLASSLESFSPRIFSGFSRFFVPYYMLMDSPRLVNSLKRSLLRMVLSSFLSNNFKISTKSWMPPVSLDSLANLKRGYMSSRVTIFLPFSFWPPTASMVLPVGLMLQARMRSPM